MSEECLQESTKLKDEWQARMEKEFPIGAHVRVIGSDLASYIGMTGHVLHYCLGYKGDYPMISVRLDPPIPAGVHEQDGFYDDEIVVTSVQ